MSFATTQWSLVLAARRDDAGAASALAELCRRYRAPVLAYLRRAGHGDAEDLTQDFFVRLLQQRFDAGADRAHGRFRQFLLGTLQHFVADQRDAQRAQKRGGGVGHEDLEAAAAALVDPGQSPERAFAREFAWTVIECALRRLREEAQAAGHGERHVALAPLLLDSRDPGALAAVAARLDVRANTLAVMLKRWRERLQQLVRAELAQTVGDEDQLEQELRALRETLRTISA